MHLDRESHLGRIRRLLRDHPVVCILGCRQVGKTTLARQVFASTRGEKAFFDLEDDADRIRLEEPGLVLRDAKGLVVLDEVQHLPEVFRLLRVLADRPKRPARFLILGSASPELLRQSSESLAGRIAFHELPGFTLDELEERRGFTMERLWLRGGFPAAFLATSEARSIEWRREFIRTFAGRDLPALGITVAGATITRFWQMLAHWHGQVWNASEIGRSLGVSDVTTRRWLDLLCGTFVVTTLKPWHENLAKRQIKSPKVYLSDSGVLHTLLGCASMSDLLAHPKLGASWEGFLLGQVVQRLGAHRDECHFWGTHQGAELDLLVVRGQRRLGFEFKRTATPTLTPSMRIALSDLRLDELVVVHAGTGSWPMAPRVRAIAAADLLDGIPRLRPA